MFCPPEYVHIHDVLNTCKQAARVQLPIDEPEERVYLEGSKTSFDPVKSKSIQRKVIELQMVKKVMEELSDHAYAFAPPSTIYKLSPKIVRLTKPVKHIQKSADPTTKIELFYIDTQTGKIDLNGTADRMTSWFGKSAGNKEADAIFHEANKEMQVKVIEEFGEIDGYTVCFGRDAAEFKSIRPV